MTDEMAELIAIVAAGGSALCASFLVLQALVRAQAFHGEQAGEVLLTDTSSPMIRSFLPVARSFGMALRILFGGTQGKGFYPAVTDAVKRELSAAGNPQGIDPDEYMGFGVLISLVGSVLGALMHIMGSLDNYMTIYTCAGGGGVFGGVVVEGLAGGAERASPDEYPPESPIRAGSADTIDGGRAGLHVFLNPHCQ